MKNENTASSATHIATLILTQPIYLLILFFIQFYVPFKIISAHMRRVNKLEGRKRENSEKTHLAHPQAELG